MKKTVIITGGTTGIGKAAAIALAKKGYNIVVTSRVHTREASILASIKEAGGEGLFYQLDVNNEDAVKKMFDDVAAKYGKVDVLVNNAAIPGETSTLVDATTENFRALFETNVLGLFWGLKYGIKSMLKTGGGSIINLTSIAGLNGLPYSAQYSASKHAVVGLTKVAAVENATNGIRVNAIAPGAVLTDIQKNAINSGLYSEKILAELHPMNRMGTPEDIANGIVFLASDDCPFMTGAILSIDGGYNAK